MLADEALTYDTENDDPSEDRSVGCAPPAELSAATSVTPPPGLSVTGCADHAESEIVPVCPDAVADALVNPTLPKFASVSGWHPPAPSQCDGASAIHSAVETSGCVSVIVRFFVVLWPVVPSATVIVTAVPLTVTLLDMWSPGDTLRSSWTGAAGNSSYHAVCVALPLASQSTAVPACSSALLPASPPPDPPSPTQNDA